MANDTGLQEILADIQPTPPSYLVAARRINVIESLELKKLKIAMLSTFTCDVLKPYLVVEGARVGLKLDTYIGPWNQIDQQILDSSSYLYEFQPDVVVIAGRLEEISPSICDNFVALSADQIASELENIESRYQGLIRELRRTSTAKILVFNFLAPSSLPAGMGDASLDRSIFSVIQEANDSLADLCNEFSDCYIFDYARLVSRFGYDNWSGGKLWYTGRIPYSVTAQLEMGKSLARYLSALIRPPSKCLVLDCDNTIWGGVIGEDGLGGIHLGEDYPGNVYKTFQRKILSLKARGFLLALSSKNNEDDVLEVLNEHPDCLLKFDDFAAMQIHWKDKAQSLLAIAEDLNINTDSLAFFDDNPVERDWIRMQMPEVTVIDVPQSPLGYIHALENSTAFDQLTLSPEDLMRPQMYQEQVYRSRLKGQSISIEDFLERLEMTATFGMVNSDTLPRVAQLLSKTNQFNLTTRRRSESDIQNLIDTGALAYWLRVTDRFGDNGLVALAIAVPYECKSWLIDSFLMSCRVMGRGVETALLSYLSRTVIENGGTTLFGEYIASSKNGMVSDFYSSNKFEPPSFPGGFWEWDLSRGEVPWPSFIKFEKSLGVGGGR